MSDLMQQKENAFIDDLNTQISALDEQMSANALQRQGLSVLYEKMQKERLSLIDNLIELLNKRARKGE